MTSPSSNTNRTNIEGPQFHPYLCSAVSASTQRKAVCLVNQFTGGICIYNYNCEVPHILKRLSSIHIYTLKFSQVQKAFSLANPTASWNKPPIQARPTSKSMACLIRCFSFLSRNLHHLPT